MVGTETADDEKEQGRFNKPAFERDRDQYGSYHLPGWVKAVNCCICKRLLLGASMADWHARMLKYPLGKKLPPVEAGRLSGRPYCECCLVREAESGKTVLGRGALKLLR